MDETEMFICLGGVVRRGFPAAGKFALTLLHKIGLASDEDMQREYSSKAIRPYLQTRN